MRPILIVLFRPLNICVGSYHQLAYLVNRTVPDIFERIRLTFGLSDFLCDLWSRDFKLFEFRFWFTFELFGFWWNLKSGDHKFRGESRIDQKSYSRELDTEVISSEQTDKS